jgi:energy-coupling factor transporter ATP-binding protein EcfA2
MLAVVFGASGSGKSTQAALLRELLPDVAVHDWDEVGGSPPPKNWRQRGNREWIDRACRGDFDFLVLGGVPGEVLAAPGAVELDGLAFCLLDCADDERVRRLSEREGGNSLTPHQLWDHVAWGVWLRFHAADPGLVDGPDSPRGRGLRLVALGIVARRRSTVEHRADRHDRPSPARDGGRARGLVPCAPGRARRRHAAAVGPLVGRLRPGI